MVPTRVSFIVFLGAMLLGLAACVGPASPPPPSPTLPADQAAETLAEYFAALHQGRFADAVALYGGPHDALQDMNRDIDPEDHAMLLQRYCTQNGGVCLPVGTIITRAVDDDGTALFLVQFISEDGSVFGQGPCCGEPDEGHRTTDFAFSVRRIDGTLRVMELPPYVP